MPKRSWDELVAEGKRLVHQEEDAKWGLGDLALEAAPMGPQGGPPRGVTETIKRFAEEIDISFETLDNYRQMSTAWPSGSREPLASWSAHKVLMAQPNRSDLIKQVKTKRDAQRLIGQKPDAHGPRSEEIDKARQLLSNPEVARAVMRDAEVRHVVDEARPSEDRAEQARRLVRDPAVARHVVQDNAARSAMAHAAKEMEQDSERRQRGRAPELVDKSLVYRVANRLNTARYETNYALDDLRKLDLTDDDREKLLEDAERVELSLGWLLSFLRSGDHSFDKELDALLREEM